MGKTKVLVTGGAGFIGSHTCVELLQAGFDAVIADNLSNADISAVEGVRTITGCDVPFENVDCTDYEAMRATFAKHSFDAVIHFAAFKAVGESVGQPLDYYADNVGSFVCVMRLAREFGVDNVLFSSSATVYGQPDTLPVTELTPRQSATSPYGNTKQICEDILRDSVAAYPQLRGISLRYFNPIGAHPSALIGEFPRGVPNNLVPFITQTAAGLRRQLSIFGDDYDTPDGTCLRDYIDITDLARAHVAAIEHMASDQASERYEVFNIGTGRPLSVLELVRTFERVNGVKVPYVVTGRRVGDVEAIWADATLACSQLGWRPERTIEETLRSAWAWQQRLM